MNLVQHEERLNDHDARLKKLEEKSGGAPASSQSATSSSLEEAIRKAKESAQK